MKRLVLLVIVASVFMIGCTATGNNIANNENLTIAKAQKEIKIGMFSSEVVEVLGSPNMVTTDDQRRETWVYDRISTMVDSSSSSMGIWWLIGASGKQSSSARSAQRTITIIIKFDEQNKVRDFAYRTSSF